MAWPWQCHCFLGERGKHVYSMRQVAWVFGVAWFWPLGCARDEHCIHALYIGEKTLCSFAWNETVWLRHTPDELYKSTWIKSGLSLLASKEHMWAMADQSYDKKSDRLSITNKMLTMSMWFVMLVRQKRYYFQLVWLISHFFLEIIEMLTISIFETLSN